MNLIPWMGILLLFLVASGCIGLADATGIAHQLRDARSIHVPEGLLTPEKPTQRETYRDELLGFRSRIQNVGGNDGSTLNAYIDGSLSLLSMQDASQEGLLLVENIDPTFVQCEGKTPATNAIENFKSAKKNAQESHDFFARVQQNPSLANALGADYILNAVQTTQVLITVHQERADQLKSACGFSV